MKFKTAGFRAMINRMLSIPLTKENYEKELKTIKYLATQNGYNQNIIDSMLRNIKKQKESKRNNHEIKPTEKYISLPFNTSFNKAIRRTFYKTKYQIGYKTQNNAFNLINKMSAPKENIDLYEKSGLYKIECTDCEKFYIGQTGRTFRSRFKEHVQAIKSNNRTSQKSNFAEHILSTGHNYKNINANMKILQIMNKGNEMDSKEDYLIYIGHKEKENYIINNHITTKNPIYEKAVEIRK